jgi:hypothetical protein
LADVFGHVLLLANRHGVDLAAEFDRKWLVWKRAYEQGGADSSVAEPAK